MKLPDKVKVGGTEYKIELTEPRDEETVGATWNREARIQVHPGLAEDVQRTTFWHELFHAMYFDAGLDTLDQPTEEQVVNLLSQRLVALVYDNPQLLETFTRGGEA